MTFEFPDFTGKEFKRRQLLPNHFSTSKMYKPKHVLPVMPHIDISFKTLS